MNYKIIYSDRKTISLSVRGGELTVRAPKRATLSFIEDFINRHTKFIEKNLPKEKARAEKYLDISESDVLRLKKEARRFFIDKAKKYSEIMGLKCSRITITGATTRFCSCSSRGNVCFSYRLMLYPEAAREYVVVHELAHLAEMNHSRKFYDIIEKTLPDYRERKKLLYEF